MFMPDLRRAARVPALMLVAIALGAGGADGAASTIAQRWHAQQLGTHAIVASDPVVARHFDAYNIYRAVFDASSESPGAGYVCSPVMLLVRD